MTPAAGYALLGLATLLAAAGQICFKKVALLESSFARKLVHPTFWLGGGLFLSTPVMSSLAAQVVDFSILYAMTSLTFVFVLLLSRWLLKERIDWPKGAGVVVILLGLAIMTGGGAR
jgi:drug/metabolite transporter (DMT)-like permease